MSKSNGLRKMTDSYEEDIIHEHFRTTGVDEAVQGLSDLFNIRLQNDDVQYFDTKWDHAGGLYKSKNAGFCSASDCIGFV